MIEIKEIETIIPASSRLGEVKEYYFSRKLREIARLRANGVDVINLGIGSPDLSPDPVVIDCLQEESGKDSTHAYQSYIGVAELRNAFSDWYAQYFSVSLDPSTEVLPLMGSKEGIMHISMAFLNEGDEVLVPNPGYPTYSSAARLAGGSVRTYELKEHNNWLPDLESLSKTDLSKVKLMWVNYPQMPTGATATTQLFKDLVVFAKAYNILLVNDNPYAFILNDEPLSILSVDGAKEVALELNSLSKAHNMAGWRVGMLAGAKAYLDIVLRFKSNMDSGMFKPIQLAAAKALQLPQSWYDQQNEIYQARKEVVQQIIKVLNCKYDEQQVGLFIWAKIPLNFKNAYELSKQILDNTAVFITPGGIFGTAGEQYIRISLCSPINILQSALNRIKQ